MGAMGKCGLVFGALLTSISLSGVAVGDPPKPIAVTTNTIPSGWASKSPDAIADVQSGKPLVIEVFVPLCSSKRGGPCGKTDESGEADNLDENIYWGAIFGARRFLERKNLGWTKTESGQGESFELERATFKRTVKGSRFGISEAVDVFLVLHAIDGDSNREAMTRFRETAEGGGRVKFNDGTAVREERVHVVGFMGRNPLLVNGRPPFPPQKPDLPQPTTGANAIPSFSISAHSRETLGTYLARTSSRALLLARGAVASEGYVLDAVARGLAENDNAWGLEQRASKTYADFQRIPRVQSDVYFSRGMPKVLWGDVKNVKNTKKPIN
jgi:hypothetical protein